MSGPPKPRTLLLAHVITTFFISLVMSRLISGMKAGFTLAWLKSWPLDWLVVWPIVFVLELIFGPLGTKMALRLERAIQG